MVVRKGDRFKFKGRGEIWECTGESNSDIHKAVCIHPGTHPAVFVGMIDNWYFRGDDFDYLGNFSKSNNFNSLYDKLNETP